LLAHARSAGRGIMPMTSRRPGYQAYLLRLWQVRNGEETHWRASLESAHADERHGFASLEALFEFLRARTEGAPDLTAEGAENAKRNI
jgi:hypothetical protein